MVVSEPIVDVDSLALIMVISEAFTDPMVDVDSNPIVDSSVALRLPVVLSEIGDSLLALNINVVDSSVEMAEADVSKLALRLSVTF